MLATMPEFLPVIAIVVTIAVASVLLCWLMPGDNRYIGPPPRFDQSFQDDYLAKLPALMDLARQRGVSSVVHYFTNWERADALHRTLMGRGYASTLSIQQADGRWKLSVPVRRWDERTQRFVEGD